MDFKWAFVWGVGDILEQPCRFVYNTRCVKIVLKAARPPREGINRYDVLLHTIVA